MIFTPVFLWQCPPRSRQTLRARHFMAIFFTGNERGNLRETTRSWLGGNRKCRFTQSKITSRIFFRSAGYLLITDRKRNSHTSESAAPSFQKPWQSEAFRMFL